MATKASRVWMNGKITDSTAPEAQLSLFTHALHYGTGIFEGIRAYRQKSGGGAVFRLREHIERFFESAKILGLALPYTPDAIVQACVDVCRANRFDECYLRPIAFIGEGPLGVFPGDAPRIDVAILALEWGKYLPTTEGGARLKISSYVRPHVNTVMTKGKITGNYVNSVLAKREARALGFTEALLLDAQGFLSEGTGENLFVVKNGVVTTTPLTSILNGITRRSVMDYLSHRDIPVREALVTRDELYCADEIFLTGTAAEITIVGEVDHRKIAPVSTFRKIQPIAREVQKDYDRIVRGDFDASEFPFARDWFTAI